MHYQPPGSTILSCEGRGFHATANADDCKLAIDTINVALGFSADATVEALCPLACAAYTFRAQLG